MALVEIGRLDYQDITSPVTLPERSERTYPIPILLLGIEENFVLYSIRDIVVASIASYDDRP